jgi:hypothetical protein
VRRRKRATREEAEAILVRIDHELPSGFALIDKSKSFFSKPLMEGNRPREKPGRGQESSYISTRRCSQSGAEGGRQIRNK